MKNNYKSLNILTNICKRGKGMKKTDAKNGFSIRTITSRKKNQPNTENAVIDKNTEFGIKEAYKTLRTNIMFSLANDGKHKVIVVTSAVPGEGKSTTVLNLAITFSQIGSRVLVIDGDLRKPKIHKYLGIENNKGLSGILSGFIKIEDGVRKTEQGFDCITAGSIPPNPSELIGSPMLAKCLENLGEKYDYVFIDSPPVTVVSDTLTMAAMSDGVLLVARSNYTPKSLLKQSINNIKITKAKVIGVVVNAVDTKKRTYGAYKGKYYSRGRYGGYGKYGYHYYYYSSDRITKD